VGGAGGGGGGGGGGRGRGARPPPPREGEAVPHLKFSSRGDNLSAGCDASAFCTPSKATVHVAQTSLERIYIHYARTPMPANGNIRIPRAIA
jgi:hypothetical protein